MGAYTVQIADVNIKRRFNKFKEEEEDVLNYEFIILTEGTCEDGSKTRGRKLWQAVTPSLNSKSRLFKLARATYGKELSQKELESFDPEDLLGRQVDCMVDQKPSADGSAIYNNILSFAKTAKKLKDDFEWTDADRKKAKDTTVEAEPAREEFVAPDLEDGESFEEFLEKK